MGDFIGNRESTHYSISPVQKQLKMRKPVLLSSETGFLGAGGKTLHELLERLAGDELNGLRSLDFDLLAGLWVHSGAGFAGSYLKSTKSDKLNALGLFDAGLDAINHGIHGALSIRFAASERFLDRGDEFDFVHLMGKERWGL
jgi:hypothetical protein